jgi:hypothetical protein
MKTRVGASPNHDLVLGRTNEAASNQGRTMVKRLQGKRNLRANSVTALHDTRNGPLRRHQGIREARVNGGCQCLSVVPIVWLQDKRIDLPRVYLEAANASRSSRSFGSR